MNSSCPFTLPTSHLYVDKFLRTLNRKVRAFYICKIKLESLALMCSTTRKFQRDKKDENQQGKCNAKTMELEMEKVIFSPQGLLYANIFGFKFRNCTII